MQGSWDDLRLILAIVDHGGVTAAAQALGVHHATVLRRLGAFEHSMGLVLFDRRKSGYLPTELGNLLADKVRMIAVDVDDTYRGLAGEDLRLSGSLRIATSDFLAQTVLPNILAVYAKRHPQVEIELIISSERASLSKRDADVAFRVTQEPPQTLYGDRIGTLEYAVFGRAESTELASDLYGSGWVLDDHALSQNALQKWWLTDFADTTVTLRVNSTMTRFAAVKAGLGIGFLPRILTQSAPELRVLKTSPRWTQDIWFLAHTDLYRMPRVRALRHVAENMPLIVSSS